MERVETAEPLRLIRGGQPRAHALHRQRQLFLASMSRLERARVVARLPLTRNTPRTLTRPEQLEEELERLPRAASASTTRSSCAA